MITLLYVFDLDGTLADITHRLHFIQCDKPDYDAFYDACDKDVPVAWTINLLNILALHGHVLVLSGRRESVREKTLDWLQENHIRFAHLRMRPQKNHEKDVVIKKKMLMDFLQDYPQYKTEFIIDDRQVVVNMWRQEGFAVLQCNSWKEYDRNTTRPT